MGKLEAMAIREGKGEFTEFGQKFLESGDKVMWERVTGVMEGRQLEMEVLGGG